MSSRKDAIGLFWEDDQPGIRAKLAKDPSVWGPMPPIPDNGWRPPTEFPNLSAAKVIGFDTETYDPELTEAGPGWARGRGHIIGASLSVDDGSSWYFPIRHGIVDGKQILAPEHAAMNMNPEAVLKFLDHVLHDNRPKVGANLIYDVGWLNWEGVRVGGKQYDIQFAEALLDSESPDVALDSLAHKYLGHGKVSDDMYEWLARWNGFKANDSQRKYLYVTPPCIAGPYAEGDAEQPIRILERQWQAMNKRGVLELFDLECRLIPLLVKMRMKGAPVNLQTADRVYHDLTGRLDVLQERLGSIAGIPVNPAASSSMEAAFNILGLPIPRKISKTTGKETITFDKTALQNIDHEFVKVVTEHRGLTKVRDTFIKSYILDKNVNSRIYCSFHPLRGLDGGTRSGRFSSADPNLQNIPVRSAEGKLVRSMFDGTIFGRRWRSFDYSSIEYRLLANYATGDMSDEVRAIYAKDPKADYHKIVQDMIYRLTTIQLERGKTKTINFGIIYGMAPPKLAASLNLPMGEARHLLAKYHEAAPYAQHTMNACANEVNRTGTITTLLGRCSDFNMWGPKKTPDNRGKKFIPVPYGVACEKWGPYNIERQFLHKALNRRLQGSAADIMKKAMVDAYEAGLFEEDACGIPCLTVHDELDFEDMGEENNPAWGELTHIMEHCVDHLIRVPLLVEGGFANTWADAH